jgi:hypothetical protein
MEVSVDGGPWTATTVTSASATVDGLTFYFDGTGVTVGDHISIQISPQVTAYALSANSGTCGNDSIDGAVPSGALVSIPCGNGAATFAAIGASVYSSTSTITGLSWTDPAATAAAPTAADFTVA